MVSQRICKNIYIWSMILKFSKNIHENRWSLVSVQHHVNAGGYGPGAFRNSRPFERNPTTWVPPAPTRNGIYLHKHFVVLIH